LARQREEEATDSTDAIHEHVEAFSAGGWSQFRAARPGRLAVALKCRGGLRAVVGALIVGGVLGLAPSAFANPTSPYRAADLVRIEHFAQEEGSLLGVVLPGGSEHFIRLVESQLPKLPHPDGPADAYTLCVDAHGVQSGKAVKCTITIGTDAHSDSAAIASVIAHEVFHVFQAVMSGTLANAYRPDTNWLVEGSAAWVDSDLVSGDFYGRGFWAGYFAYPKAPLFSRGYSAIGWFGHLASSGVDLWKRFPAIFSTTSNMAAYATATLGTSPAFLQDEASVFFREPAWGPTWDQEDQQHTKFANDNVATPGEVQFDTHKAFQPQKITFAAGDPPRTLTVAPYADRPVVVDVHLKPSDPFLLVTLLSGHARIHAVQGEGNANVVDPDDVSFCAQRNGCSCPGNPVQTSDELLKGDLAITGGTTGGSVKLSSGGCDLKPRACVGLLPTSDFQTAPPPADWPAGTYTYTTTPLTEVLTANAGQCGVDYTVTVAITGAFTVGPSAAVAGIYSLNTFKDAAAAQQALASVIGNWDESPVSGIGDEAYVGTESGAVRVRNDVFHVNWDTGIPPGETIEAVLRDVVQTVGS
jgi:hypothetical protein